MNKNKEFTEEEIKNISDIVRKNIIERGFHSLFL